ncbi:MAG: HpcH/HpaI aldolase/citrate lyase family protein [Dehalococcoidia bacterium]
MRENTVIAKWKAGEPTFGCWLAIPSSFSAEVMARQGFDYVCIDMQHGIADYQVAVTMLQAISQTDSMPFVRVPWNEPGIIGRMLDAGAMGVVIPMVNSVEEAERAVGACRYAPSGYRSFGPVRAGFYAGADYFAHANEQVACIPMIETRQAIAGIDDILGVPGIDAVYVGPADLSITLGLRPAMDNEGEFKTALETIVSACGRHGVTPGIHASAQLAEKRTDGGFKMITVSSDTGALASGAASDIRLARGGPGGAQPTYR